MKNYQLFVLFKSIALLNNEKLKKKKKKKKNLATNNSATANYFICKYMKFLSS